MSTSQLACYNGALRLCRETKLAALTENREARYLLDDVWADNAVNYCLEQGQWNFAIRTSMITADPDFVKQFGYANRFEYPADWLRTVGVASDEYFNTPMTRVAEEAGNWFADVTPIYVRYVSSDPAYGGNMGLWSPSFEQFIHAYLADRIVAQLTTGETIIAYVEKKYAKLRTEARSISAMNESAVFPPAGSWVVSRRRGNPLQWDGGNTGRLIG